jgi:TonB family protein
MTLATKRATVRRRATIAIALALCGAIALAAVRFSRDPVPATPVPAGGRTVPVVLNGSCPTPVYPAAAGAQRESGVVMLNFLVGTDGSVVDSRVETSSGHAVLDEAARVTLSRCRFQPGTLNGRPEASWHIMKYVWSVPN